MSSNVQNTLTKSGRYTRIVSAGAVFLAGFLISLVPGLEVLRTELISVFGTIALVLLGVMSESAITKHKEDTAAITGATPDELKQNIFDTIIEELSDVLFSGRTTDSDAVAQVASKAVDRTVHNQAVKRAARR